MNIIVNKEKFNELAQHYPTLVDDPIANMLVKATFKQVSKLYTSGKIKYDLFQTERGRKSFLELYKYLKKDIPDETIYKILNTILQKVISDDEIDPDKAILFMRVIKQLDENDIRVLFGGYKDYKIVSENSSDGYTFLPANTWLEKVALYSSLKYVELCSYSIENLSKLKLINRSIVGAGGKKDYYKISVLGIAICEFIEKYGCEDLVFPES